MTRLRIAHPGGHEAERRYVLDVVFGDWLGLDHVGVAEDRTDVRISLADDADDRTVVLSDAFFRRARDSWLEPRSLPASPLPRLRVPDELDELRALLPDVVKVYGEDRAGDDWLRYDDRMLRVELDLLGSIFFLLTRYEEQIPGPRDGHGRFSGAQSLAGREGLLERPLANEYLEILWACLRRCWPRLKRRRRGYAVALSHDIDRPYTQRSWWRLGRSLAADLLVRRAPGLAARRAALQLRRGERRWQADPNNSFALIMATSERHGLKSTFYVKGGCSDPRYDEDYLLDGAPVAALLREIHDRGHELGLHPSYHTWLEPERIGVELARLQQAAAALGVRQEQWGGRQHYLRFRMPDTWRHYEATGLAHDATLGFADRAGFRCGTCYEFAAFDLGRRQPLRLRERPLTVMEGSLFGPGYMGLAPKAAHALITRLATVCRSFRGTFSLLWHNSELLTENQRLFYVRTVSDVAG